MEKFENTSAGLGPFEGKVQIIACSAEKINQRIFIGFITVTLS
jgi:hypothetical protein